MTTAEVADYLRIGERKVYQLVSSDEIPRLRVGGKLLFPRGAVDQWLARRIEARGDAVVSPPAVLAGSEDVLLDRAVRESGCGLAVRYAGSTDGVRRLVDGEAMVAGLHLLDPDSGEYNTPPRCGLGGMPDLVLIEWARRRQGLVIAAGNPLGLEDPADLPRRGARLIHRQQGAGAEVLLQHLLQRTGIDVGAVRHVDAAVHSESDLAAAIASGRADCGIGIEAVARSHGLDFIPLQEERFDLALRRREYFEYPIQRLLEFARGERFHALVADLCGYDVSATGRVTYNA